MSDLVRAALWMMGAIFSLTFVAVAGRALAALGLDSFEIMLWRNLFGVIVVALVLTALRRWNEVQTTHLGLHAARNISHFTGLNLWFTALPLIPLAQVFALEFTAPVWVILFSPFLLHERLTRIGLLAAAIGFCGILVLSRPWNGEINMGTLGAAASAIGTGLAIIFTRRLTKKETTLAILFWLTGMQALFSLICAGWDMDLLLPDAASLPWLIAIGIAGLMAHFCLTTALGLAPAALVMPVDFLRLPLAAAIGALWYGEALDPWFSLAALLIIAGNWLNLRQGSARPRAPSDTHPA